MGAGTLILIVIFTIISERGGILGAGETPVDEIPEEIPDVTCKRTSLGETYKGTDAVTFYNKRCQRWDAQSPNQHSFNKSDMFPQETLQEAANYCRNPSKNQYGPWCYLDSRSGWTQWCWQIPFCKVEICNKKGSSKRNPCICQLTDSFGRDESEAQESFFIGSEDACIRKGKKGESNWVSYDQKSKVCKLYGKKDISQGVIAKKRGTVKHYILSACDLLETSPYQKCLRYRDANFISEKSVDPYSGFVCRKGLYKAETWKYLEHEVKSDINSWKRGGPITTITIQEQWYNVTTWRKTYEFYGLTMNIQYGKEAVQRGSKRTEDPENRYTTKMPISKGDCINRIEVNGATYDQHYVLDKLIFHTRNGEKQSFGLEMDTVFDVKAPDGTCLAFMDHIADTFLKGIAFVFEPISKFGIN